MVKRWLIRPEVQSGNFCGHRCCVPAVAVYPGDQPNRQRTILIKNRICYRLVKSRFRFRAISYALSLQDDYFKSTIAITLKLADHVLTLFLSRMVPKKGPVDCA